MAKDDFALLSPMIQGGMSGDGDAEMSAGGDPCSAGVGAGGRCGAGTGGVSGTGAAPPIVKMPDASSPADTSDGGPDCGPEGARGPNGDCYYADSTLTTWSTARLACSLRGTGWDLATIRTPEDNAFVAGLIDFEAWLGATDATTEGAWIWVTEELPFFEVDTADAGESAFTSWNAGEPNDYDNSDCLRLLPTGLWADLECTSIKGRVCQLTNP